MQHENVDKDPDLRKSSDLGPTNPSWVPRLITLVAILAAIVGVVLVLIYYSPAWGPNQWGNVGTWAAGIATSLAVAVAVWQTNNANKQARAAEKRAAQESSKAAERHRTELEAAEKRLVDELDAQRRDQQVVAIAQVWAAITELAEATNDLLDCYPDTIGNARDHSTHDKARALFDRWKPTSAALANSFVEPNLLVSDHESRKCLSELQDAANSLRTGIKAIQADLDTEGVYNGDYIRAARTKISEIYDLRVKMLITVRKNIAKVPALSDHESESLQPTKE